MFEYYGIQAFEEIEKPELIHDMKKYLLNICNKKTIDQIISKRSSRKIITSPPILRNKPQISYRPKEKYPSLVGATYNYFKVPPKRKQLHLSALRNDCSQSTPRLKCDSMIQDHLYESQIQSARIIQTHEDVSQQKQNLQRNESKQKTYYLPKSDNNWIMHLKNIKKRNQHYYQL